MKVKKDKHVKNSYSKVKVSVLLLVLAISLLVVSVAMAKELGWARKDGGSDYEYPAGIAVDLAGNSYVTGNYGFLGGTTIFGAEELNETDLPSLGGYDIFVAAYNDKGDLHWARYDGGSAYESGLGIAIDGIGNIYVTGYFNETSTFRNDELNQTILDSSGMKEIFVAAYNSSGDLLWARQDGGPSIDDGVGIAVDGSGKIYVAGHFGESAIFGAGESSQRELSIRSGWADIFVASYDSNGDFIWVSQAGGSNYDKVNGIAVDGNGNSYVTGHFDGTIIFGEEGNQTTLYETGYWDIFLASYDSNGILRWAKQAGGEDYDFGVDVAVSEDGNVYLVGDFYDTATFGMEDGSGSTLISSGYSDIFVAAYDSSGNHLWARQTGGSSFDNGFDIDVDKDGKIYVTGHFTDTVIFGAEESNEKVLSDYGGTDIYVACYNSNGDFLWVSQQGGSGNDSVRGIDVDGSGNSYITGTFFSSITFDAGGTNETVLSSSGSADIYVAKILAYEPLDQIIELIDGVNDLIDSGGLNEGQINSLIRKLEAAAHSVEEENIEAAIGQLGAFINAIEAAIQSGKLTVEVGQPLIDAAQEIIVNLESQL